MPSKKSKNKEWLQKLRFNSWELEILLVGFVLVILFQIPDKIQTWSTSKLFYNSSLTTTLDFIINHIISPISAIGVSSIVYIIIFSLAVYLMLRGFWIAIIGLSSAFPDGINIKRLNFYEKYEDQLKTADFEKISLKLDKICSSIFAFAFILITLVITITMLIIYFLLLVWAGLKVFSGSVVMVLIPLLFYIILALMYFIDIVSLGSLKKIKWKYFAESYYYIYSVFRVLTLGFVFEKLHFYFVSNLNKKNIIWIIIGFLIIYYFQSTIISREYSLFPDSISHNKTMIYHFYEDNLNNENVINELMDFNFVIPRIQSHIIDDGIIELFIPYEALIDNILFDGCDLQLVQDTTKTLYIGRNNIEFNGDKLFNKGQIDIDLVVDCINSFYQVEIDDEIIMPSNFLLYQHPYQNQKGFFMVLDISKISNGSHYLTIQLNSEKFNIDDLGDHIVKKYEDGGQTVIFMQSATLEVFNEDYSISIPFYKSK